jgi:hypothetical protein
MLRRHVVVAVAAFACAPAAGFCQSVSMNELAESYMRLVLALGQHDADYVDAYYGPPEWRAEEERRKRSLAEISADASGALASLVALSPPPSAEEILRLRYEYLTRQLQSLRSRVAMLAGSRFDFDAESQALYDAVAPTHTEAEFAEVLAELERRLPGDGPLSRRYETYRAAFVIPKDRLSAVFAAAIDGCRARTLEHIDLPATESFTLEYVTNKSWSGYNWYQGNYSSLIQINTDLPIYIDRAIDLACHEGYPGHHVYNVLLEQHLVRERGWQEFSVYALFSPQSLIAEGTANYGIDVAFPEDERRRFEREVLFPAAGLDASAVDAYYDVMALVEKLSYAGNEAARRYRNGEIDGPAAAKWHETYALMSPERAAQRVRFIDQYGAYVINYNLGKDLIARHIERLAGADPERRWSEFAKLLSSPRLPSALED